MDAQQQQQQQQQQQYLYQYQPQNDTLASQSYDPSQIQSYDQSTQAYYAYHHPSTHYNQPLQPDYSSYYYQNYAASYQSPLQTDPNEVHPPGVSISVDSQQIHGQNPQNLYYPHGAIASQPPPHQQFYQAGSNQVGQSGRGRGTFGRRGRGRGGGRGKPQTARSPAPSASGGAQSVASSSEIQPAPSNPQPRMAWCELCRVDCTTFEVLEQHKNGKKHKRNLKLHEELQNLSKQITVQTPEMSVSQLNLQSMPPPEVADGSQVYHPPNDNIAPEPAAPEGEAEAPSEKDTADKPETSGALPSQELVRKDHLSGRGGLKRRMMKGARGGKWMRNFDGSRRPVVPLICELCHVKCESQVVFESHIAGKKHLANVKRFQGHKEAFGEGIQALYPTISNLPPSSILPQANQLDPTGLTEAQALASTMLSQQNLQDPQAAQAALAELLHQHGIRDAQTLIAQLIPYLLAQFQQVPSVPIQPAGLGIPALDSLGQAAPTSMGAEGQNVSVENISEQQNVAGTGESQAVEGTNDKPADVPPENSQC